MVIKRSVGEHIFNIFNIILMLFMVVITLYPFLYVVFASFSVPLQYVANIGLLVRPLGFTWDAYRAVINNPNIISGYRNTIFIVFVGTALSLLFSAMGAYVLSRRNLYWRKVLTFLLIFTMYVSGGMIPDFLLIRNLGLIGSRWSIILPGMISTWNLIILRTAFYSIPDSLEESARIDGAWEITILFKVLLPLLVPTLAVIALFYGVSYWNEWFRAMIYVQDRTLHPLQLILREILINAQTAEMTEGEGFADRWAAAQTIRHATIIVATIPILCLYPFLQKYFVKGVMVGAVKG